MDKCIKCEGTGKVTCKTCNGEGKVTCSACGGSGREISICPTCTKGKVPDPRSLDDEPTVVCPDCHGEWQKDVGPCKACNGTGKVTCATCEGAGKVACDLCNGSGNIDIESMCKSLINMAEEVGPNCSNRDDARIFKDRITSDMAAAIFDAANNGVGIAAYVASCLCQDDEYEEYAGDKVDYEYCRSAAVSGNMIAQYMYITNTDEDWGADDDWEEIKKSAEQGFVPALELLAGVYYNSKSDDCCVIDLPKSLECWKKIIAVKDNDAWNEKTIKMAELHVKYLPAIIKGDAHVMMKLGKSLIETQPKPHAFCHGSCTTILDLFSVGEHWLEQAETAIGLSDMTALRNLAKVYLDLAKIADENPIKNKLKNKAYELYMKMADAGDTVSQSILGESLRRGDGIEKDARKAFIYLYQAAEKGDIVSLRHLAHLYRDGDYAEKNRSKANELYVRAAKSGDGWSLYEIGRCYLNGNCVTKDEAEAKRLLKLAVEKGVKDAGKALSTIPDSVKDKKKGPSGIVVGKPEGGSLPKFATADYRNAVDGKPSERLPLKKASQLQRVRRNVGSLSFLACCSDSLVYTLHTRNGGCCSCCFGQDL